MSIDNSLNNLLLELENINSNINIIHNNLSLNLNNLNLPINTINNISSYLQTINDVPHEIFVLSNSHLPPTITLNGDSIVYIEVLSGVYNELGASAFDLVDGNLSNSITISGTVNILVIGTYIITYSVTDSYNNSVSVTRTIVVQDSTPPTIFGLTDLTLEVNNNLSNEELMTNVYAIDEHDNYIGHVTSLTYNLDNFNNDELGIKYITYTATDAYNNSISQNRKITIVDSTPPLLTLIGDSVIYNDVYTPYIEYGATAIDNYDNEIQVNITGFVDISLLGMYTITYNATDSNGNSAIPLTRTVNVIDSTAPVIVELLGENPLLWNRNTPYLDPGIIATDNYDNDLSYEIVTNLDITTRGLYTYKYIVSDDTGNSVISVERYVYILDFSILNNYIPVKVENNKNNNTIRILDEIVNTHFNNNNELILSGNFALHFKNRNKLYHIPTNLLNELYNTNNIIIHVYGFENETISVVPVNNYTNYDIPFISNTKDVRKLVNICIDEINNNKLILLNGKYMTGPTNELPTLNVNDEDIYVELNGTYTIPDANAYDYNGDSIDIDIYNNIDVNTVGTYYILYIANGPLKLQASKLINVYVA